MMCGTERFKEVENKGVVEMAAKKICTHPGCTNIVLKEHLCWKHLTERDGKQPYKKSEKTKCTTEGCDNQWFQDGLCWKHLTERDGITPKIERPRCIVPGCDKIRVKDQMCRRHYVESQKIDAKIIEKERSVTVEEKFQDNNFAAHPNEYGQLGGENPAEKGPSINILTIEIEGCKTISIDFSQYPELHKSLCDMARVEYRQPAEQILFLIAQAEKIVSSAADR
jgi:hypothetical protein